jgi:hypothetical protein
MKIALSVLRGVWYNAENMTQTKRVLIHIVRCHFERAKGESRNLFVNRFPFVSSDESARGGQVGITVEMTNKKPIFLGKSYAI